MPSNSHPTLPLAGAVQASAPTGVHPTMRDFMWFAPVKATGNHLAAQNDEPEPMPRRSAAFRKLDESINAEIRAERALRPELDGIDKAREFSPRGKV